MMISPKQQDSTVLIGNIAAERRKKVGVSIQQEAGEVYRYVTTQQKV
jgi:hypothetical protein